ncbi:MAG: VPLPA-CTERM sorting domain-containing protein [Amphiplicatus sp.]
MKIQTIAVASAFALFAASGTAWAAPCSSSSSGTCFIVDGGLSTSNPLAIQDQNVLPGAYSAEGSFSVDPGVTGIDGFVDIAFDEVLPGQTAVAAGFSDLTISFMQDAIEIGSFVLTNPDGTSEGGGAVQTFMVTLISTAEVFFSITGDAFLNSGASLADFNINLVANTSEVPVPAALPLMLAGIAGLGFASRKKRAVS